MKTEQIWFHCELCGKKITHNSIHNCSPQLRKLTDEEIRDIFYTNPYLKKGKTITYADFYFAREILQKESE